MAVNRKQRSVLDAVFTDPVPASLVWSDIEMMLAAVGAEISEGSGSRVRVKLNNVRAVFHRPHPEKEAAKGAVKAVRQLLESAGIKPTGEE